MKKIINPKVSLVGAGPGDPDLLTIKGYKALQNAKVVLYDALVNKQLLDLAPQAKKIFVGKRKGKHSYKQEEINELLVQNALKYGYVVRLKGGDPFIFGRGSEEQAYINSRNIETEVISGISSSSAVPANAGIPLTSRGLSDSFWVLTGSTRKGELSKDIYLAAQSNATIVVLMGMTNLDKILAIFKLEGKSDLPVGIIQNGTTPAEKIGIGTVSTIANIVADKQLSSPAIIVLGEVVKEQKRLKPVIAQSQFEFPLSHRTN